MLEWADIAVLAKAKNLQGGFVVRSTASLPFLLEEGMEVAFVPPVLDVPRRAKVRAIEEQGGEFVVFFEGVEDRSASEALAGCHCLVRRADLPEDALAAGSHGLIGWTVRDEAAGFSGTVSDVIDNPGQALLEIADDDGGTVLVPLVDEFVLAIDEEARFIELNAPAGLFDLR